MNNQHQLEETKYILQKTAKNANKQKKKKPP